MDPTLLPDPIMPTFAGPTPDDLVAMVEDEVSRIEGEVESETKPTYPHWFDEKDYPKPDPAERLSYAREVYTEYGPLRNRFQDDIRFLFGDGTGNYESGFFADATKKEKDNGYHESMPEAEHELIVAQLGAIDPIYKPEVRRKADRDEAADKADFLYAADAEAKRKHVFGGNGAYRPDVVRTELIYGRVAAQILYKTECGDGELPFRENLIDPATCCPVFDDDRGMCEMIRVYRTTIGQAKAAFNYDKKFLDKLESHKKGSAKRDDRTQCEVIEYWDRWWKIVWVDSCLIVGPVAHKLGKPPFIYQMGAMGLPAYVRDPSSVRTYNDLQLRGETIITDRDTAMPNKGVSHIHLLRFPVRFREAVAARMMTAFRRSIDPAWLVGQTHIADQAGVPELSNEENAVSTYQKDQEDVTQNPVQLDAGSLGPLTQLNNDALGRLGLPASAYGISEGISSGFALEGLAEAGRDKLMPHLVTLEAFYQQVAERRLELFRDWGWLMKQGEEPRGSLYVARTHPTPYQDPQFQMMPETIRRTGCRVSVSMTRIKAQSLSQVANGIAILRNAGLGYDLWFYEMLGHPNPERAIEEQRFDAMLKDPALQREELIAYLRKNGEDAIAAKLEMQGPAAGSPPMQPTDALSGGAVVSPTTVATQGMSLPGMNMPPGPVS